MGVRDGHQAINLSLPQSLITDVKKAAIDADKTVSEIVADLLTAYLKALRGR